MKLKVGDKVRLNIDHILHDALVVYPLDFLHDLLGSKVYIIAEIDDCLETYTTYSTARLEGYTIKIPLSYLKKVK